MLTADFLAYGMKKLADNKKDENLAKYLYKYVDNKEKFIKGIDQIIAGIPVQYIVGNVNFYGFIFNVNASVLIPRFETEELVNKTFDYIEKNFAKDLDVVDVGTGTGCIAVTLKKLLPYCHMSAVDISLKALDVACDNAKLNSCDIDFHLGDLLSPLTKKYDVIISNPPYIDHNDYDVMDIVKNNEPKIALYAGNEGLENYENILKNANKYLKTKSMIALEIGADQGKKVANLAKTYFPNSHIIVKQDMQDRDRFIFVFNNF
ncbi:MAG: peptide chain release factor N(5)-glutamine methyltransferase [Bacilli bacterium]